jgi:hypothetical protein
MNKNHNEVKKEIDPFIYGEYNCTYILKKWPLLFLKFYKGLLQM